MILYVSSDDMDDRGLTFGRHSRVSDVSHLIIPQDWTPVRIVREIISTVRNRRSIWLLILNAHGQPGTVWLGQGVNISNVDSFAELAPYMTPGGRGVEIHACYVASRFAPGRPASVETIEPMAGEGITFLRRLAFLLNCPVRAGYETQAGMGRTFYGLLPASNQDSWGQFEGRWVYMQPNGAYVEMDPDPPR